MLNDHLVVHVEKMLEPILPLFIEMRWKDLRELRSCIEKSDFEGLKKLTHKLLGAPGSFGFHYLVKLAQDMEIAIGDKDTDKLNNLADQFESFMRHCRVEID